MLPLKRHPLHPHLFEALRPFRLLGALPHTTRPILLATDLRGLTFRDN